MATVERTKAANVKYGFVLWRNNVKGLKITTTRYIDTNHNGHIINSVNGTTPSSWLVKYRGTFVVRVYKLSEMVMTKIHTITGPKSAFTLSVKNFHWLPSRPTFEYHAILFVKPTEKKNNAIPTVNHVYEVFNESSNERLYIWYYPKESLNLIR